MIRSNTLACESARFCAAIAKPASNTIRSSVVIKIIPRSPRRRILLGALICLYIAITLPILPQMPPNVVVSSITLITLSLWVSYIDMIRFRIPDAASIGIFVSGAITILWIDPSLAPTHLVASICSVTLFWTAGEALFRRTGQEMLGIGDAKLFGAGTMWVSFVGLPSVLLVAALTGIAYAALAGRHAKRIPFGPFIALGFVTIWLYGPIGI
jgi:prepilin signal peptidase PulO-like enzyme (type II secretory pathway)